MLLHRSGHGNYLQRDDEWRQVAFPLDDLFTAGDPRAFLKEQWDLANHVETGSLPFHLAPAAAKPGSLGGGGDLLPQPDRPHGRERGGRR